MVLPSANHILPPRPIIPASGPSRPAICSFWVITAITRPIQHAWGFLPEQNVLGKALVIYWPFADWKVLKSNQLIPEHKLNIRASD